MKVQYRLATPADAPAIAHLHATSWQHTYRGAFSDHYLDREVHTERLTVWTERFATPNPAMLILLAEEGSALRGFCCTFLGYGPDGHLLDNLHVAPGYHGRGIGKALMQRSAARIAARDPDREIYLWVLTDNTPAIAFYERLGGRPGRTEIQELGTGNHVPARAMYWSVADLLG
ncbi:MAG: GNAT family N-acetyltransferase [Bacteroidota bacterium]